MFDRESTVYEDADWEAVEFEDEEISTSESIVARGQFWISYMLGKIRPIKNHPPDNNTMVMIKSCPTRIDAMYYKGLLAELKILHDLSHLNVVKLIGFCGTGEEANTLHLVFQYCANGNLKRVLQKGRPYFDGGTYCPRKIVTQEVLSPELYLNFCGWHLLKWTAEIARGMEYLAFKGVIHCDLAARNILLTCDWTAKIGNFGISQRQKVQDFSNISDLAKEVFPIAWMAPESIKSLTFSEKTDVWSYGVTLWEIYTLGEVPFRDDDVENDMRFVAKLAKGIRPPRAEHANENIWDLITSCWSFESGKRPTFSKIKTFLERTVLITKPQWETKLSLSGQSGCPSAEGGGTSEESPGRETKKKAVTFNMPEAPGSLLKKCVCAVDEALIRHGLKT